MRDTTTITITVSPLGRGMFEGRLGARLLCTSHEPLCAGARVLLAEGIDPSITIQMEHADSSTIALRAKIGASARLTIEDGPTGAPRFRRWRAPRVWGVSPPARFAEAEAPRVAPEPGVRPCEAVEVAP